MENTTSTYKDNEHVYNKISSYESLEHDKNKQRIKIGLRLILIIPMIFLIIMFLEDSNKIVFLVLWIASLFFISAYLISIEYMDYKMQLRMEDWGIHESDNFHGLIDQTLMIEKVIAQTGTEKATADDNSNTSLAVQVPQNKTYSVVPVQMPDGTIVNMVPITTEDGTVSQLVPITTEDRTISQLVPVNTEDGTVSQLVPVNKDIHAENNCQPQINPVVVQTDSPSIQMNSYNYYSQSDKLDWEMEAAEDDLARTMLRYVKAKNRKNGQDLDPSEYMKYLESIMNQGGNKNE